MTIGAAAGAAIQQASGNQGSSGLPNSGGSSGSLEEDEGSENKLKEKGVGNPVGTVGKGSTGRTTPKTLEEQMAMHQVQSNPLKGATKVPLDMNDSRWPASEGWVKMQSVIQNADGTKTTIHFVYNENLGLFDDFKFVLGR